VVADKHGTGDMVLLMGQQNHCPLCTITVWMALRPLVKSDLPVVFLKSGKIGKILHAKVHYYGIGFALSDITKVVKHHYH